MAVILGDVFGPSVPIGPVVPVPPAFLEDEETAFDPARMVDGDFDAFDINEIWPGLHRGGGEE
ncbi:hypothetical protein [Qipengyuania oceanensis]|uniref:Uncharacterized protein n=1 Tax=Qipengyuania oceanensis TaxID=1463597 RepID=A0A844YJC1_9SPHN|nr:hypothetical protein [Qipengyuania oceanensis]MXO63419.1 hypothetical protein [Qipengyuania oceanensis]